MFGLFILSLSIAQPPATTQPPPPPMPPAGAMPPMASPSQPAVPKYPSTIAGKSLNDWLKDLSDNNKDGALRELAVKVLPQFGPTAREPSLKPLIKAARTDEDPGVRVNAILALGTIGANNKDEAKQIIDALKLAISNSSVGGVIRLHATRAISNYGQFADQANDAIPTLVGIAKDPSWETRKTIAYALGQIGGPTKTKVEVKPVSPGQKLPDVDPKTGPNQAAMKGLLGMLQDSSAAVRLQAVESLTLLGPPAVNPENYSAVVTPYMNAIADRTKSEKDKSILIWLYMLTMRLDGNQFNEATMTKMVELGKGTDLEAQMQVLQSLSLLGEKSLPVGLPFARDMLKSPELPVIVSAAQYFAAMGIIAKQALPDLEQAKSLAKEEWLKQALTNTIDIVSGKKPTVMKK